MTYYSNPTVYRGVDISSLEHEELREGFYQQTAKSPRSPRSPRSPLKGMKRDQNGFGAAGQAISLQDPSSDIEYVDPLEAAVVAQPTLSPIQSFELGAFSPKSALNRPAVLFPTHFAVHRKHSLKSVYSTLTELFQGRSFLRLVSISLFELQWKVRYSRLEEGFPVEVDFAVTLFADPSVTIGLLLEMQHLKGDKMKFYSLFAELQQYFAN